MRSIRGKAGRDAAAALVCACCLWASPAAWGRTWVVAQTHPQAADDGPGTEQKPFKTIAPAAAKAQPGDTVRVHAGIYRERVKPARGGEKGKPIVYEAAVGETVVIKGSDVYGGKWEPVAGAEGVYRARLEGMTFGLYNPFQTPHCALSGRTRGQVFVDGRRMREVGSLEAVKGAAGTWMSEPAANAVIVHFPAGKPPGKCLVELTTRTRIFAPVQRGLGYITVRGFVMEHCGNNYQRAFYAKGRKTVQAGALGCRGGHHWVVEHNTIRWAKALGIDCGDEGWYDLDGLSQPPGKDPGYHVIRHNTITDNGCGGIAGLGSMLTKIIGNRIERNNYLGIGRPETAGVKMHFFVGGLIEGNLFRDNETYGVWLDNVYAHARVTRNVFLGNKDAGMFFEMGGGPVLFDNNVVAFTRGVHNAAGVYAHDAGGLTICHNLIVGNALWGCYFRQVTGRSHQVFPKPTGAGRPRSTHREKCRPKNIRIVNNVILANGRGLINMPYPGPNAPGNFSDCNLFSSGGAMSWLYMLPFVTNTNGGVNFDGMLKAFDKAMDAKGVPAEQRPRLINYHKGPLLGLEQWQALTKYDLHSAQPKGSADIVTRELLARVQFDEASWKLGCKPVEGVEKDFFGKPMPAAPLPGPFQRLQKGGNEIVLWPVPVTKQAAR
jgi:hypothetical protein